MIFIDSNGKVNQTTGGLGCLLIGLLGVGLFFYGAYWFLRFLWWASPVILALAVLIEWRSVAHTGRSMLQLFRTDPIGAVFRLAAAVFLFPLFSFYLFMKAILMRQTKRMTRRFEQNARDMGGRATGQRPVEGQQRDDGDFIDFEELETRKKERE